VTLQPEWVWGVDVAAGRADVALVHRDGGYHLLEVSVDGKGAARLAALYHHTRELARSAGVTFPPLIVYVERPTGQHRNPPLDHAAGVIQAALYEGLSTIYPHPVSVELVAVSDWKGKVIGNGNAGKGTVAAWALQRGHRGSQDAADALAIAACAALECGHGPGPLRPIVFA
jgi:Holliday junction resolvasome RuvABC endonuclease subunit